MLVIQRWRPLTCGCEFLEAWDDCIPDDVLPATEKSRAVEHLFVAENPHFITRSEAQKVIQQHIDRIERVTKQARQLWQEHKIDFEEVFDRFHLRNSLDRGRTVYEETELDYIKTVNLDKFKQHLPLITPEQYYRHVKTERRKSLYDFLYGRAPAQPSAGVNTNPLPYNVLCELHESLAPMLAHAAVREYQRSLAGLPEHTATEDTNLTVIPQLVEV